MRLPFAAVRPLCAAALCLAGWLVAPALRAETLRRGPDAFLAACVSRLPPVEIQVLTQVETPPVDNTLPSAELAALRKQALRRGQFVVGLTLVRQRYDMRWNYRGLREQNGARSCLRSRIEVTLTLTQQVYVASEFPLGSCGYDEVIAHEQRHVAANLAQLDNTARFVEDSLREQEGGAAPWLGEPDALRDAVLARARRGWMSQIESHFREVDREHAKIDTVEESQRYKQLCNGEMEHTLREIQAREAAKGH